VDHCHDVAHPVLQLGQQHGLALGGALQRIDVDGDGEHTGDFALRIPQRRCRDACPPHLSILVGELEFQPRHDRVAAKRARYGEVFRADQAAILMPALPTRHVAGVPRRQFAAGQVGAHLLVGLQHPAFGIDDAQPHRKHLEGQ